MSDDRGALPALIVLAKSPLAGRVKTRCSPPCSPEQAAALAEASLRDTLRTVLDVSAARHVLVLDGPLGPWLPIGFEVIAQRPGTLGERIDAAFADVGGPAFLIGMDTPQIDSGLVSDAMKKLAARPDEALVGPADDGGFWAVGLGSAPPGLFAEVPMSRHDTCRSLLLTLARHSIPWTALPFLGDFDDYATACAIAETIPGSHFAAVVDQVVAELGRPASQTIDAPVIR